jgi:general secretion pathway protein G
MRRACAGFSLIELMVVMAVLGVLAAAAYPLAELVRQREQERELKQALWEIRGAIDAYKRARDEGIIPRSGPESGYPPNLLSLVEGVVRATPGGGGGPVYLLRRIPRDPFAPNYLPAEQTWGLRSYDSPPDRPRPGADVYDVYSTSSRAGLDGVPLRQW